MTAVEQTIIESRSVQTTHMEYRCPKCREWSKLVETSFKVNQPVRVNMFCETCNRYYEGFL